MIKKLASFGRTPVVYKSVFLILLAMLLYIEIIAPVTGLWSPRPSTFMDLWFMNSQK
ncbi:MAG: hypothetical protein KF681_10425 [Bdellovibrionaceae bacterium]|nr:hypothetical protein [Pseudobdellovibrionaceae bacterium]